MVPWIVLVDGNGNVEKGFKSEWATVKDDILYIGSMGKEWTTASGEFQTYDPMWVKAVNMKGEVIFLLILIYRYLAKLSIDIWIYIKELTFPEIAYDLNSKDIMFII